MYLHCLMIMLLLQQDIRVMEIQKVLSLDYILLNNHSPVSEVKDTFLLNSRCPFTLLLIPVLISNRERIRNTYNIYGLRGWAENERKAYLSPLSEGYVWPGFLGKRRLTGGLCLILYTPFLIALPFIYLSSFYFLYSFILTHRSHLGVLIIIILFS